MISYNIYTDGSCRKNGVGGYGYVVLDEKDNICDMFSEQVENTTNNQMELKAILSALKYCAENHLAINSYNIYTDSAYSLGCVTDWFKTWRLNGWKTAKGTPVANRELIEEILKLLETYPFCHIQKTDGHSNIYGNELADALATGDQKKFNRIITDFNQ